MELITSMNAKISISMCLACGLILSGCAEHLERKDTVNSFAGDSVARNKAVHIINPTPWRANRRHIHHNGNRFYSTMDIYENPEKAKPNKVSGSSISNF